MDYPTTVLTASSSWLTGDAMKNRVLFLSVLLALTIFYWFSIQDHSHPHNAVIGQPASGEPAPDFTVKDEQGREVRLSDLKGKVVLVHFWATWCPPCVSEFPLLNELYGKLKNSDFVLLAVSMDEKGKKAIDAFRKKISFDFPVYLNPDQTIADLYGSYGLPESFLIDKQGVIVRKIVGPQEWNKPSWEKKIRELF